MSAVQTSQYRAARGVTHHGVTIDDPYAWLRDPAAEYRKWYRRPVSGGPDAVIPDERLSNFIEP